MNEYLVTMTTRVPDGTSEQSVDLIKTREAARAGELAAQGRLLRLWMLPDGRALGLWRASGESEIHEILASLPLAGWLTVETTALSRHPSDPVSASRL